MMKENSPLKEVCGDKKLTNHSARKTVVKKLKSHGVPKCEIQNITGHTTEQGLDDYDSGNENEQRMISNIIDNCASDPKQRALSQPEPFQPLPMPSTSGNIINFSHCHVTLNIAGDNSAQASLSQSIPSTRPFKRLILQDSDSD